MAVKKLLLLFVFILTLNIVKAQCTFTANANVTINNPSGCNIQDGSLNVTAISGGISPYTYVWETYKGNFTNTAATGLINNVFQLAITDANNCIDKLEYTFNISSLTVSFVTTANTVCGLTPNGGITINTNGGVQPLTYFVTLDVLNLSYSSTTNIFNNLNPGNYVLSIEESNRCYFDSSFTIADVSPSSLITLTTTINDGNIPCGFNCVSTITSTIDGGTAPYSYAWNNDFDIVTNQSITGMCQGANYILIVTDANQCAVYKKINYYTDVNVHSTSSYVNNITCGNVSDGSIIINSFNGGTPPFEFSCLPFSYWQLNPSVFTTNTVFNFLPEDTYVVEIKDANNCLYPNQMITDIISENCGNLKGKLFNDINNNCVFDGGDIPIVNYNVIATNGIDLYSIYTDINGNYITSVVDYGTYTVYANPNYLTSGIVLSYCVTSYTSVLTPLNYSIINNFACQTSSNCGLNPFVFSMSLSPGFNRNINFSMLNDGFIATSGLLTYTLPKGLTYNFSTPSPASVIGQTLVFSYTNINNSSNAPQNNYYINVLCATSLTIGSTLMATLNYDVNCTNIYSYSNSYVQTIFVTGPYDPNHKMVWPSQNGYDGDILETDNELTYKVEFQNIGSASAVNAVVIDTLSPLLDETSIRQLASSHSNKFVYNSLSRQMQWRFNNINLPDSTSNPTGSIGYFTYKVKQKSTNVVGDVIKNTAHIYFDFNSAIVTNTTKSTIVELESIFEYAIDKKENKLFVYPNPSTGVFSLVFNCTNSEKGKLIITDITGKTILQQSIESKNGNNFLQINSNEFSSGAYFVSLQFQQIELHQKVIIQK